MPKELDCLNTLELVLISKRLLFKKIMPKGQTPKIHGSLVNVPVNVKETCDHLPQEGNCEEVIFADMFILSQYPYRELELR